MIVGHIGGAASSFYDWLITKSIRLRASANAYLSKTYTTAGNTRQATFSFWLKNSLDSPKVIYGCAPNSQNIFSIAFDAGYGYGSERFHVSAAVGNAIQWSLLTTRKFRDPSAWYHFVVVIDTPNAVPSDRVRIYVNGVRETAFDIATYPTLNYDVQYMSDNVYQKGIGQLLPAYSSFQFGGYLAEFHYIDGQALSATEFGSFESSSSAWIPKKYTSTYGTNGFYLPFNDGSTLANLAADRSGNGNNWTANNISLTSGATYDWMDDTPTNNYCTLNPLQYDSIPATVYTGGMLGYTLGNTSYGRLLWGTQSMSSGKWYAEFKIVTAGTNSHYCGIVPHASTTRVRQSDNGGNTYVGSIAGEYGYGRVTDVYPSNAAVNYNGTRASNGTTLPAVGDVIGLAFDADTGKLEVYLNGTLQTLPAAYATIPVGEYFFACSGAGYVWTVNFGQHPFAYSPPAGFKALCTKNLPLPNILNPKKHFDVVLATGANIKSTAEAVFPDNFLEWIKDRGNANNHQLIDIVRGTSAVLQSNTTAAETTYSAPSGSSVGWLWKAGGAPVTNNAGSIQSQVSANPQAGFSIVTYTGTGANATVGHGLGIAPKMVVGKNRNNGSVNWYVWHSLLAGSEALLLNLTSAKATDTSAWNSTVPTSSVFSVGTGISTNASTASHIAYCFAEIPGFSKIGSYTGNGSADGPFVYCGFRPRYLLIKRADAAGSWEILDTSRDTYNLANKSLFANLDSTEDSSSGYAFSDLLSNGFKVRTANAEANANTATYIYMAIADVPFNYANAR